MELSATTTRFNGRPDIKAIGVSTVQISSHSLSTLRILQFGSRRWRRQSCVSTPASCWPPARAPPSGCAADNTRVSGRLTAHSTQHTAYYTQCVQYTAHGTQHTLHTIHSAHCILYISYTAHYVQRILHSKDCTQYTVHTVYRTLHIVHCPIQITLHIT